MIINELLQIVTDFKFRTHQVLCDSKTDDIFEILYKLYNSEKQESDEDSKKINMFKLFCEIKNCLFSNKVKLLHQKEKETLSIKNDELINTLFPQLFNKMASHINPKIDTTFNLNEIRNMSKDEIKNLLTANTKLVSFFQKTNLKQKEPAPPNDPRCKN